MTCTLCVLVVALPLVVPIGAIVLRVAVWLANRVLGRPPAEHDYGYEVDEYVLPPVRTTVIPAPGFGKAVWISGFAFLACLAAGAAVVVLERQAVGLDRDTRRILFLSLYATTIYLMLSGLLTLLLPTTFRRAGFVAAFAMVVSIPVVATLGGLALVGLNAIAPNMGR